MNKFAYFILVIILSGCTGDDDLPKKKKTTDETGEITGIETLFDADSFNDPKHVELLKELKICSEFQKDTSDYMKPACSPRFFKIFPMRDDAPVENAFLLQIKSKVGGVKLRRLVTFEREKGELIKINAFVANLIGTRKSKTHYPDLILRFNDNVEGDVIFYNCVFAWNGKMYKFQTAETIEGNDSNGPWRQRIKAELKDSVSTEIYNTLVKNEMIL
ncbi:MAG: hypothetical protein RI883_77 [Bacteroidota bacterium]|jgi:hypothetical protein